MSHWSPLLSRRAFLAGSAWLGAAALTGCGETAPSSTPSVTDILPDEASPFDWRGLVWVGEKLEYFDDDRLASRWGIDVSEHQGDIDWRTVMESTVQFAFVRIGNRGATEGTLNADPYFHKNAVAATEVGIEVSAYYFSQALTEDEAREEANSAIVDLAEAEADGATFAYVAYDHEPVDMPGARANDLSERQFTANARAFCEVIAKAGYKPMIYGNPEDLARIAPELRNAYPIWYAEYGVESPTLPFDFAIWQYTNAGTVPGINHEVDLNIWFD